MLSISDVFAQPETQDALQTPLTIIFAPLEMEVPPKIARAALKSSLHKMFILNADYRITEALMQTYDLDGSSVGNGDEISAIPLPPKSYLRSATSKYAELNELDDFIVCDDEDPLNLGISKPGPQLASTHTATVTARRLTIVDWENIYRMITERLPGSLSSKRTKFAEHLQEIRSNSEISQRPRPGVLLLSDFSTQSPRVVEDVEECSATLSAFSFDDNHKEHEESHFYQLPLTGNLLDSYQGLVSHWLGPLSSQVPDRVRVNKERLARTVAADIALSTMAIRSPRPDVGVAAVPEKVYSNSAPAAEKSRTPFGDNPDSPLAPALSQLTPLESSTTQEHPACNRLRAYTTIASNTITAPDSASLAGMLSHLPADTDIDPATYDWRGMEASIAAQIEDQTIDPKARRRAEKLANLKRKRTEMQNKVAGEMVHQRAPPTIGSSQMILPTREVQSSQVRSPDESGFGDHTPMTQPERGAFGTRIGIASGARREKMKKRAAGF